ncbi:alpha/beta fold hydrolase [Marinobacter sp. SS13-12]|uniref:alpha/beta fold hydrolase n=1 Tax=Marinobacter sp. SS13-12 TaxID=3050451 RepID=UPI002557C217|nr:alpha/beta fold hydrolase [Marinobacter sp. SS13-12]MDK8465248.1 alpha/beta fold hydrolase [Marinobacter sp. SS13-12]
MRQRIGFCTTEDDVRIAYATSGRGRPLLRVGGWMTHIEHDLESPVWRHWLQELTRNHTLARFDIRGSGLSDRHVNGQTLEAWVRDVEAVVDSLGWRQFPMLGVCQGAAIAVLYAVRHPEKVTHLVLYNPYAHGAFTEGMAGYRVEEAETLARMIEVGWARRTGAFREVFARLLSPSDAADQISWWDELQRLTADPSMAARLWRGFHEIDIRELLPQVHCPTLVAHVKGDSMVPFEAGRDLAGRIPHCRFLPLEGRNHILQPRDPGWRIFIEELRRFLADEPGEDVTSVAGFHDLTRRERVVLDHVARGRSNAAIAGALSLAPKTVRNHVSNICGKLAVSSRPELVIEARNAGFGLE